jgi:hypothetical protein
VPARPPPPHPPPACLQAKTGGRGMTGPQTSLENITRQIILTPGLEGPRESPPAKKVLCDIHFQIYQN